jgi:signal transduction histidine kinase
MDVDPRLQNVKEDQFISLRRALTLNKKSIVETWAARCRKNIYASKKQIDPVLIDAIPELLDEMCRALSNPRELSTYVEVADIGAEHGRDRAKRGDYTLSEHLAEYHILQQVLFEILEKERSFTTLERDTVLNIIQVAIRKSAVNFISRREPFHNSFYDLFLWSNTRYLSRWLHYAISAIGTCIIFSLGLFLNLKIGGVPFLIPLFAAVVASLFSGFGPAVLSIVLSQALLVYFVFRPYGSFGVIERADAIRSMLFCVVSLTMVFLGALSRSALLRFRKREKETRALNEKLSDEAIQRGSALISLDTEKEMREKFVATLTHDLLTPITAIKMSAQIIERNREIIEAVRVQVRRILNNVERADQMIQDLLDANRIRAGEKLPLYFERWDLNEIVQETVTNLITIYGNRIVLRSSDSIFGVWDRNAIRRIIENLVGNAIKYGAAQKPVTVTLKDEHVDVKICVHNEGPALSAQQQKDMFDSYKRIHQTDGHAPKGWGLGLTLVKGVAEAHGGQIQVESSDIAGTTFCITLPKENRA